MPGAIVTGSLATRTCLALALPVAAFGALGCGEDSSSSGPRGEDEAQVEAVAAAFEQIVAARDTEAFCEILAPNDVLKLGRGRSKGREECLTVWGPRQNPLFRAERAEFDVERLSFEGSYATAKLANGGELAFAKEGGRWYVHLAPGPGQGGGAS
jgi:hypothetical protein